MTTSKLRRHSASMVSEHARRGSEFFIFIKSVGLLCWNVWWRSTILVNVDVVSCVWGQDLWCVVSMVGPFLHFWQKCVMFGYISFCTLFLKGGEFAFIIHILSESTFAGMISPVFPDDILHHTFVVKSSFFAVSYYRRHLYIITLYFCICGWSEVVNGWLEELSIVLILIYKL